MGTFQVSIEVGDARGLQFQRMEAMVDTGATYLVVSSSTLIALGCQPISWRTFKLSDNECGEPLFSAVPLETFSLAVDPGNSTLIPVPDKLK